MIEYLKNVSYYGGTSFDCLPVKSRDDKIQFALLFSDGFSVLGNETPSNIEIPVYAFNSDSKANFVNLKRWAQKSGGEYFNLTELNVTQRYEALKRIGKPSYGLLRVEYQVLESNGKPIESTLCKIYPNSFVSLRKY